MSALTVLGLNRRVGVFDSQTVLEEGKISTKTVVSFLKENNYLPKKGSLLIVTRSKEVFLSTKNIPNIKVVKPFSLTVSLLYQTSFLLCDEAALQELVEAKGPIPRSK